MFQSWPGLIAPLLAIWTALAGLQLPPLILRLRSQERLPWILVTAFAVALGVWSVQLLHLLAWQPAMEVRVRALPTVLALLPLVLGALLSLSILLAERARLQRLVFAVPVWTLSLLVSQQMLLQAVSSFDASHYDPLVWLMSGLFGLGATLLFHGLLVLVWSATEVPVRTAQRLPAAVLVGMGWAGMHQCGLLAVEPVQWAAGTPVAGHAPSWAWWVAAQAAVLVGALLTLAWSEHRRLLGMLAVNQRKVRSARRFSEEIEAQSRDLIRALLDSQQRLALAMEGSQDGLWDVDVAANEVLISRRMAAMLGLGGQDLTLDSSAVLGLLEPAQRLRLLRALVRHWRSAGRRPLECDLQVWTEGGGRLRCLRLRGSSVLGEGGGPLRVAGSLTDVSLQRQHERELESCQHLLDALPQPMLVLDPAVGVEFINAGARRWLPWLDSGAAVTPGALWLRRILHRGEVRRIRRAIAQQPQWQGVVRLRMAPDVPLWLHIQRLEGTRSEPVRHVVCGVPLTLLQAVRHEMPT